MHPSRAPSRIIRSRNRTLRGLIRLTGSCLLLACCSHAWSDSDPDKLLDRWYAGIGLGWSYPGTLDVDSADATMDLDQGAYQLMGAVGRRFGDDWRVEMEYMDLSHDPELLYSSSAGLELDTDDTDETSTSGLMLNVVRDFSVGQAWRPYVGLGVGRGKLDVRFSEREILLPGFQRPSRAIIDDGDRGLAWQFIAGFTVPLTSWLEMAADFRYWQMPDVTLSDVSGTSFDTDHSVKSAWLHLRYHGSKAGAFQAPRPRQTVERGWYLTGSLGGGFAQDEDIEDQLLVIDAFALGPTLTAAVGYHLRPRWRVELEAIYLKNDVEVMEFSPVIGEDSASGSVESFGLMANLILQFRPESAIRPFVGIGGGMLSSSYKIRSAGFCSSYVCNPVEERQLVVDDKGTATAGQLMAGVDVAITERLRFSAAYRALLSGPTEMERPDGSPFDTHRRQINSVTAGFRYNL